MPKRKKLTDADVKKVESVILSDTDVEKADRSKYGVCLLYTSPSPRD